MDISLLEFARGLEQLVLVIPVLRPVVHGAETHGEVIFRQAVLLKEWTELFFKVQRGGGSGEQQSENQKERGQQTPPAPRFYAVHLSM